jgi:phosphoheptose isomerase
MHKLPTAQDYPQRFDAETLGKLKVIIDHSNEGGGAVDFDYLNVFMSTLDANYKKVDYITELSTSSGSRKLDLTVELIETMYRETIMDIEARTKINKICPSAIK